MRVSDFGNTSWYLVQCGIQWKDEQRNGSRRSLRRRALRRVQTSKLPSFQGPDVLEERRLALSSERKLGPLAGIGCDERMGPYLSCPSSLLSPFEALKR